MDLNYFLLHINGLTNYQKLGSDELATLALIIKGCPTDYKNTVTPSRKETAKICVYLNNDWRLFVLGGTPKRYVL